MKKNLLFILLILANICVFAQTARTVYISTESAELKSSTGVFSETVAKLFYGEQLSVITSNRNSKWIQVALAEDSSISGWIQKSSTTERKIINRKRFSQVGQSDKELALAGKGLDSTDNMYDSTSISNYNAVDIIENFFVSNENLQQFIQDGNLNEGVK